MILPVVKFGNPVLRQKGARIESITPEIRKLIADMFETMYAFKGIGLAAQQVGVALQLTTLDLRGVTDRPSTLWFNGESTDVAEFMPLVLINPQLTPSGKSVPGAEGCLSFPEIFAEIARPEFVEVKALDGSGKPIEFRSGGLLSRAIQHEADHLNGILFIDRMDRETKEDLRSKINELQEATREGRELPAVEDD
jgi:peptide deformylase